VPAAPRPERVRPRPLPPRPPDRADETSVERPPGPAPSARLALVIDDLGRDLAEVDRLLALGVPISYAVLPFETQSEAVALRLREAGAEVLVHLPMEPAGGGDPGPGAVLERLSPRRIAKRTEAAVDALPGATGVNNHMGSRITADESAMGAILDVVARRGLFFLDSRTTAETRAFEWARERGIPATRRDVFLDDDPAEAAVAAQFAAWLEAARTQGAAVAIGHPREATLAVLERELPRARAAGFELVPVSFLLERSESLPE
jgi:polysaccharide deacetylase 2 family uncharacterized protein YibQ